MKHIYNGLAEARAGINIAGRNIDNLRYADDTTLMAESEEELKNIAGRNIDNLRYAGDTTLMAESEEELKNLLMKMKEESEKAGLKLNTQNTKIMASGSVTLWQIDGETMETVRDFIVLASKIPADGTCGHEIKGRLFFGRKVMTNLDSILENSGITLPKKVHVVKGMIFSSSHV